MHSCEALLPILKKNNDALSLLPADEERGFVVLSKDTLVSKALEAIESTFLRRDDMSLAKVKKGARAICKRLNLGGLAQALEKRRGFRLVFLSENA